MSVRAKPRPSAGENWCWEDLGFKFKIVDLEETEWRQGVGIVRSNGVESRLRSGE